MKSSRKKSDLRHKLAATEEAWMYDRQRVAELSAENARLRVVVDAAHSLCFRLDAFSAGRTADE